MNLYQLLLFGVFVIIFSIFQMDDNVRKYFIIKYDYYKMMFIDNLYMRIAYHPKNPISKYFFERKYRKNQK